MKKILFILAIGIATLISCSEDDSTTVINTTTSINEYGVLLKKAITTLDDGNALITGFTYDENKLMSIVGSDGTSEIFTYTDELLTRLVKVDNGGTYTDNLEYDSSNRLVKITDVNGNIKYEYVYNSDETITQTDANGSVIIYTLTDGNLFSEELIDTGAGTSSIFSYKYLDMSNPLKNIHKVDVFALCGYISPWATGSFSVDDLYREVIFTTINNADYPVSSTTITIDELTIVIEYFYE